MQVQPLRVVSFGSRVNLNVLHVDRFMRRDLGGAFAPVLDRRVIFAPVKDTIIYAVCLLSWYAQRVVK